jgi:hypothetical protein
MVCILILGAFSYQYIKTIAPENRSLSLNEQVPHTLQGSNSVPVTRSFQVGAYPSIVIKGYGGNVSISTGSVDTVIVKTDINGSGQAADSKKEGVHYTQSRDGQRHDYISIATEPLYKNVNYDVIVPRTAQVKVTLDSGSVYVDGVSGVITDTTNGSLDIENVDGFMNVHTENGDITAHNIKGRMTMETRSGSIRANNINGQLKAVTRNGDVIVKQAELSDQSILKTMYGSVRFAGTLDSKGTYSMMTQSGNAIFQLHAHIGSGAAYNDFGNNTIDGDTSRAQIGVSIGSGSVRVHKTIEST